MEHFRYIDHIRKPNGTLRDWKEHDILAKYEGDLNLQIRGYSRAWGPRYSREVEKIKERECNER